MDKYGITKPFTGDKILFVYRRIRRLIHSEHQCFNTHPVSRLLRVQSNRRNKIFKYIENTLLRLYRKKQQPAQYQHPELTRASQHIFEMSLDRYPHSVEHYFKTRQRLLISLYERIILGGHQRQDEEQEMSDQDQEEQMSDHHERQDEEETSSDGVCYNGARKGTTRRQCGISRCWY